MSKIYQAVLHVASGYWHLGVIEEHTARACSREEIEEIILLLEERHQLGRIEDKVDRIWYRLKPQPIVSMTVTLKKIGGENMNKAYQLIAAAIATLAFLDAAGKTVATPPKGSTIVWASSDTSFATVTPATDDFGGLSATVAPVDTTGATPGSSVISATLTQPDGTIVVISGTVANTDDVTVGTMTFAPVAVTT